MLKAALFSLSSGVAPLAVLLLSSAGAAATDIPVNANGTNETVPDGTMIERLNAPPGGSAYAFNASNGGSITANGTVTLTVTSNGVATGAQAITGGTITFDNADITASTFGVVVSGANSRITSSGTLTIHVGQYGVGVYADSGGVADLARAVITTDGNSGYGADGSLGGTVTIHGGSITTTGDGADGVHSFRADSAGNGSRLIGENLVITTSGVNGYGVEANSANASIVLSDSSITTSGSRSSGMRAIGGNTNVNVTNVTIVPTGDGGVVSGWRPLGKVISAMFELCGSGAVMSPACKRGLI